VTAGRETSDGNTKSSPSKQRKSQRQANKEQVYESINRINNFFSTSKLETPSQAFKRASDFAILFNAISDNFLTGTPIDRFETPRDHIKKLHGKLRDTSTEV
jgi:hypothetical protein